MRHDSSRVTDRSRHQHAHRVAALVALAWLAGAAACNPNLIAQQQQAFEPCTFDAGTAPVVCELDAGVLADDVEADRLPSNELPKNSLAAGAVNNRRLLDALRVHALVPGLFTNPTWDQTLFNDGRDAIDLTAYIVSCALDPCDVLALPPATPASTNLTLQDALVYAHTAYPNGFRGELGLCGDRYNARMGTAEALWNALPATAQCQERVSACVLARVNAVSRRVMLSMRGKGFELSKRVPIDTEYRENRGTPIRSFAPCSPTCGPGSPTSRNCGWRPQYVGQCVVGRTVTLQVPANTHAPIRVCRGIHGCDDRTSPDFLRGAVTDQVVRRYGDELLARGMDKVMFPCPANGPFQGGVWTGYYAVMIADPPTGLVAADEVELPGLQALPAVKNASAQRIASSPNIASSPYDVYPAPEAQVFTFREGAFFGTLWEDPPAQSRTGQMLSGDKYTCFGRMWSQGAKMASDRYCAGTSCFDNNPEACDTTLTVSGVGSPDLSSPVDGEVYDSCTGRGKVWNYPYTVYLNHPCDNFAGPTECLRYLAPDVARNLPVAALP